MTIISKCAGEILFRLGVQIFPVAENSRSTSLEVEHIPNMYLAFLYRIGNMLLLSCQNLKLSFDGS